MISERRREAEWMDQPDLDPQMHLAALRGLRRLNRFSRSAAILWPTVAAAAADVAPAELRVLDLACGGGDNALALAQRARQAQLHVDVCGCDVSPVAISAARRAASTAGIDQGNFFHLDVLNQELPRGFHVLMCSLFLHHLNRENATQLIRKMAAATETLVLICDLRRSWRGMGLAWAGSRLLTRSPIVHVDAIRSVSAAFVEREIVLLTAEAGLNGCVLSQHWPQRWLMSWRKS
jgi:2-polyprenyl-3-methyl-5-hydroxy-6-metoxy-1,4-benzoquinol methylase